jgi:hypothetical protein
MDDRLNHTTHITKQIIMSRRNIWLSFSEWELIRSELTSKNNNSFYLNEKELKRWKEDIQIHVDLGYDEDEAQHCFERCYIYGVLNQLTSPKAHNILCREYWRSHDIAHVMDITISFISLITNYVDDIDMNTTEEQWEDIRIQVKEAMGATDKRYWDGEDIVDLYKKVVSNQLVSAS